MEVQDRAATVCVHRTRPGNHESPTVIQFNPDLSIPRIPESSCGLNTPEPNHMDWRTGRDSATRSTNPEGPVRPIVEKWQPKARKMRVNVYYCHQESGKDVMPPHAQRERLPRQPSTMQSHDPQADNKYMLFASLRSCTMCPIKTMVPANWQPRNHSTRRFCETMRKARSYL